MQKALVIPKKFEPYTLDAEHPIPEPGAGEILIKTKAVALNPADWMVRKMGIILETFPAIAGLDIAGEVVKLGDGVDRFKVGDRVFVASEFAGEEYGAFQQFVLGDALTTALIPSNVSYEEAATLPTALLTSYLGFFGTVPRGLGLQSYITAPNFYKGQGIFIAGASSSMGQAAIQTARLSGFTYIIASASLKHAELLKSLGATHVVDRNTAPHENQATLKEIEGLPKIEYAFDGVGLDSSLKVALAAVGPAGKVATVNPHAQYDLTSPENEGKVVCRFAAMKRDPENVPHVRLLWGEAATELLREGKFKGQRFEVIHGGLNGIVGGLARLEKGEVSGVKLVVHPEETT